MTSTSQLRRIIDILPPAQLAHGVFPDPCWEQWHWLLTTGPTALSPWRNPEASVQISLAPDVSDGDIRHEFREFADDQIWEIRPGRVSERCGGKEDVIVLLTLMLTAHHGSKRLSPRNQFAIRSG